MTNHSLSRILKQGASRDTLMALRALVREDVAILRDPLLKLWLRENMTALIPLMVKFHDPTTDEAVKIIQKQRRIQRRMNRRKKS